MRRLFLFLCAVGCVLTLWAQRDATVTPPQKTRMLLILDCSNSMWDHWQSDAKIKVTQQVLLHFIDSVAAQNNIDVALRVFGHLNKDSYGTKLEVPFGEDNTYRLRSKIKTLVPNGGCTAASALDSALHDFPAETSSRNIILIITDGIDDSDGNICNVARQVQLSGIVVQTFILGIGNPRDFQRELDCAGKFKYIPNEEQYAESLYSIFRISDQRAHLILDIKDAAGMTSTTETPIAFYDSQTRVVKYLTRYTGNLSDTLHIDPLVKYNVEVFTNPPTIMNGLEFAPGKTSTLSTQINQGRLRVRQEQQRVTWPVPKYSLTVRCHGASNVLHTQQLGDEEYYLAGTYDIDVMTLPAIHLEGVEVRGEATTDLSIPMPGMVVVAKPKQILQGSIFHFDEGVLTFVCDLNPNSINERIVLQPGDYMLVAQPQSNATYGATTTQRFSVESAKQTNVVLK